MIKPDYHIAYSEADSQDWSHARLIIEWGRQYFHYVVVQDNDTVLALKYYQWASAADKDYVQQLEEVLAADEILKKNIPTAAVIYNVAENHLVPREFYEERLEKHWVNLLHGDLSKDTILCDKLEDTAINNIYRVPTDVHEFLKKQFSPAQFVHFYSSWIEWKYQEGNTASDSLYIIFYPNEFQVMLVKNNGLQLMQRFTYQVAEDVGYHLLNIYDQYKLSIKEFPLWVSGMIAVDSDMYNELLKYFMLVDTVPTTDTIRLPEGFTNFPPHFFSPILKIAVCV